MKRGYLAIAIALTAAVVLAVMAAAHSADRDAVAAAALDYVEAVYDVQPDRIRRSVHPSLVKRGFYRREAAGPYTSAEMTFDQLVELASRWNRDGRRDTSIKKVDVLDVLDQTAIAQVTASWGVDHLLLAKYDGRWQIVQILWQSPPPKP